MSCDQETEQLIVFEHTVSGEQFSVLFCFLNCVLDLNLSSKIRLQIQRSLLCPDVSSS